MKKYDNVMQNVKHVMDNDMGSYNQVMVNDKQFIYRLNFGCMVKTMLLYVPHVSQMSTLTFNMYI